MSIDPNITYVNLRTGQIIKYEETDEVDESIKNLFSLGEGVVIDFFNNKLKNKITDIEENSKLDASSKKTETTASNIVFPITDNVLTSIPRGSFLPNSPLLQFNDSPRMSPRNSPKNSPKRSLSPCPQSFIINLENISAVALFFFIKFNELGYSKFLHYMDSNKDFSLSDLKSAADSAKNYHRAIIDPYVMRNLTQRAKNSVSAAKKNAEEFGKHYKSVL
ncbi:MAG: hypothetical protein JHC93_01390 [Parachlamydiales bacterium]|nr:hypothetical protein [Parachlamydiales bacterium]